MTAKKMLPIMTKTTMMMTKMTTTTIGTCTYQATTSPVLATRNQIGRDWARSDEIGRAGDLTRLFGCGETRPDMIPPQMCPMSAPFRRVPAVSLCPFRVAGGGDGKECAPELFRGFTFKREPSVRRAHNQSLSKATASLPSAPQHPCVSTLKHALKHALK